MVIQVNMVNMNMIENERSLECNRHIEINTPVRFLLPVPKSLENIFSLNWKI